MDVLILGGTGFLSKEAARSFIRAGHDVTCAARGITGAPPEGARFIAWDRDDKAPEEILELTPDIVIDVSSSPTQVAAACALFPDARWLYISTISVYPTMTEPCGTPADTSIHEPIKEMGDLGMEAYGGLKVACENRVRALNNHMIIRPGLIVGPRDPSGRFAYWPSRIAQASLDGFPYIAPLPADDPIQWIDVRDLADWLVHLALLDEVGTVEAVGQPIPRRRFLAEISAIVTAEPAPIWLSSDELKAESVGFWAGERAIPFWLPVPELQEMLNRDPRPARELGLAVRPLTETARDTLSWHLEEGHSGGLTREDELAVLRSLGHITDT